MAVRQRVCLALGQGRVEFRGGIQVLVHGEGCIDRTLSGARKQHARRLSLSTPSTFTTMSLCSRTVVHFNMLWTAHTYMLRGNMWTIITHDIGSTRFLTLWDLD